MTNKELYKNFCRLCPKMRMDRGNDPICRISEVGPYFTRHRIFGKDFKGAPDKCPFRLEMLLMDDANASKAI